MEDETKVKATKEEADAYYNQESKQGEFHPPPLSSPIETNFISDLFFLLNSFQHLGLNKTIGNRTTAERNLSDVEKELKRTEASAGDWAGVSPSSLTLLSLLTGQNPQLQAQGEATIKKLKVRHKSSRADRQGDLATLHSSLHAYDTQLLDRNLTRLNLSFIDFLMTWLVRLVDPQHQYPRGELRQVPLSHL